METFSDAEAVALLVYASVYASQHRVEHLVFDLTGNTGGFVKQVKNIPLSLEL